MWKVWQGMSNNDKFIIDGVSVATTAAALFQYLPAIATIFTIVWTAIRIYETKTVQKLLGKKDVSDCVEKD